MDDVKQRLYLGSDDGVMFALHAVTGAVLWTFKVHGWIESSAALIDDVLVFGAYDNR